VSLSAFPFNIRQVKPLVYLLLLATIAWLLGRSLWLMFYPAELKLVMPDLQIVEEVGSKQAVYAPVYLFGKSDEPATAGPISTDQNVKKTKLNLRLLGVLLSPQRSVAIISKSGKSESYAVDEEIQSGVVLEEVHPDYVVISNRGLLEKLQMTVAENVFSTDVVEDDSLPLTASQRTKLEEVKANALKSPVSIMRYVRFEPVNQAGMIKSVKVWPQQETEIFNALGFQAGDELVQVDGIEIDELSKSPDLWKELLNKSYLDMTIKRNGQEMPLSVQLQ